MTNAQALARKVALEILKAYHREIKSGFVADASAVERERGQSKAFDNAEANIRKILNHTTLTTRGQINYSWLNEPSEES